MTYTMTVRDGRSGAENSVEFNISVLPRFVVTQTIYVRTVTSSTSVNIEVASVSGGVVLIVFQYHLHFLLD